MENSCLGSERFQLKSLPYGTSLNLKRNMNLSALIFSRQRSKPSFITAASDVLLMLKAQNYKPSQYGDLKVTMEMG
jgi:hypothetical protein